MSGELSSYSKRRRLREQKALTLTMISEPIETGLSILHAHSLWQDLSRHNIFFK